MPPSLTSRRQCAILVTACTFLLYLCCLAPTVTYGGDCGELIAASYRLGIAHPTGYPLYCLLARFFALLVPFGEIGWRYNLFSAVCGALATGLVTATVHRLLSHGNTDETERAPIAWASSGAGLLFAGFIYFGSQCVIAEIYALGGLLLAALLYNAVVWYQDSDWRFFYGSFLLFGLALNAHLSCLFLVPGLLLYAVIACRDRFKNRPLRHAAFAICLFLLGFSLTLYLPLRARTFPPPPGNVLFTWWPLDWGHPADFSHWLAHITGRQYRHLMGHYPLAQVPDRLLTFFNFIVLQYLWCVIPIGWGTVACWKKEKGNRWLGGALLLTFLFNIGTQIRYDVSDFSNFMFPAYVVMALWLGFGLHWFFSRLTRWGAKKDAAARQANRPASWSWRTQTFYRLALIGTVVIQWTFFVQNASRHGSTTARDAAQERAAALEKLQRESGKAPYMLAFSNDTQWAFWYVQYVLGQAAQTRTPWSPEGNATLRQQNMADLVAKMKKDAPVALSFWDEKVDARFPYIPLTESGNLWLASSNELPQAATLVKPIETLPATVLKDGRFRRSRTYGERNGRALLKREDLAAFEVNFVSGFASANKPLHGSYQFGWVEVLLANRGVLKTMPPPTQGTVRIPSGTVPSLRVWKQRRRLIVSRNATPGIYRAIVPIQIEGEAPTAVYDVWTRIVHSEKDTQTPWLYSDSAELTHR